MCSSHNVKYVFLWSNITMVMLIFETIKLKFISLLISFILIKNNDKRKDNFPNIRLKK